ncbi:23S rRNA pseudouridine(2604) synthase RluF [Gilvimarinus agarilyticus]|uniref:23S rRNA pseudouridine(2604) synthase RluF n=1 Tax=Gilvimarinus agarilyticus TaxID=679259 RepID=UPI0005A20085|nr:23S rRNA pseudouridine(2604) synthase RluF [Gilvimarinus agarilyticus]
MLNTSLTRLNKYISESGMCSRRDADRFIEQGNVYLNGKRAQVGDQVAPGDTVRVNGQLIEPQEAEDLIFIALNKPVGIVSTTESSERNNIVNFVRHSTRIFPIGRLDKDSQGLIFLTNNGDLVNKILRAGNNHEKEYLVTVNKPIRDDFITGMSQGVPILGTKTKKCKVSKEAPTVFRITLVQGLNRQIRRMCEHFGYDVVRLERVKIMNVSLKGLPVGEWRDLTEKELKVLLAAIEDSSSEAPAGRKSSQKRAPKKSPANGPKARGAGKSKSGGKKPFAGGGKKSVAGSGKKPAAKSAAGGKNKPAPAGKNKPGNRAKAKPTGSGGRQKPGRAGSKKPRR